MADRSAYRLWRRCIEMVLVVACGLTPPALLVSIAIPSVAWAASGPIDSTNYNSVAPGDENYEYWSLQAKSPDRVSYVLDPAGKRGTVQRIELRPGDSNVAGPTGERAEVVNTRNFGGFVDGQTVIMSWGVFIDSRFASPPGDWNAFAQIHAAGGGNQAPLQLGLSSDAASLSMYIAGGGHWVESGQPNGSRQESFALGPLAKNRWHDFVIEIRFGCTGKGYAKLWLDGAALVAAQNRAIGYCGDPGLYWKQGFYRSTYDKVTRLWFSDTFRWANAEDALAHYRWGTSR